MTLDPSNPAGRLYIFFDSLKRYSDGTTRINLASRFGLDPDDYPAISKRLNLLRKSCDQARKELSETDLEMNIYGEPLDQVDAAIISLFKTLNHHWEPGPIRKINLHSLRIVADILSKARDRKAIEQADRDRLLEQTRAVISEVRDSGIPVELKSILLKHLARIEQAILLYEIGGMEKIIEEEERLLGTLVTNRELALAAKDEPAFKNVVELLKNINAFWTFTNATLGVINYIFHLTQ